MTGDQPKVRQNIMLTERLLAHNLFRPEGGIEILSILFYFFLMLLDRSINLINDIIDTGSN